MLQFSRLFLWLTLLPVALACGPRPRSAGSRDVGDTTVSLRYVDRPDILGVSGQRFIELYLQNAGQQSLSSCRVTLNGTFTSPVLFSKASSSPPLRPVSPFRPHQRVRLQLSHDTGEYALFKNADGRQFPYTDRLQSVSLVCTEGSAQWAISR